MINCNTYEQAERRIIEEICRSPDYRNKDTVERLGLHFCLNFPSFNRNTRSNYTYAEAFFIWMMSGETVPSEELLSLNPEVRKFTDSAGLPEGYSSSYGPKIIEHLPDILSLLKAEPDTRQAYLNILLREDLVARGHATTHEYPCTIGLHFLLRNGELSLNVQMRSNNAFSVLPYDVYLFTSLQTYAAQILKVPVGRYRHYMSSAHVYRKDHHKVNLYFPGYGNMIL